MLAVDDVIDTGKSLQSARGYLIKQGAKDLRLAALYCRLRSVMMRTRCSVMRKEVNGEFHGKEKKP